MYKLSDYDYSLPEDLIAQFPEANRERSRLLHLNRKTGGIGHHVFFDLYNLLSNEDFLIVNNTEVVPGRLLGHKETGGKVEVLILNYLGGERGNYVRGDREFQCLIKASKRPRNGTILVFDEGLTAKVIRFHDSYFSVRFSCEGNFDKILYKIGKVPLPPYIRRNENDTLCDDKTNYQTVYATQKGAIAAPTAGLHFSEILLEKLKDKGISTAEITLHVGYGTFLPVRSNDIRRHRMHSEYYSISEDTAIAVNNARKEGRRIIAVGTTSVRTLEYAANADGSLESGSGMCDLFITPGYEFKIIGAMITNFHLPKSTLLMLVSAFAGRENVLCAYQEAINEKYRFYSYGDAMLIS
jgi:S-adenosylmethionine:tRNA ribosyltransferase-isomerase